MRNPEDRFQCENCDKMYYFEDSTAEHNPYFLCSEECEREARANFLDEQETIKNMHK